MRRNQFDPVLQLGLSCNDMIVKYDGIPTNSGDMINQTVNINIITIEYLTIQLFSTINIYENMGISKQLQKCSTINNTTGSNHERPFIKGV